MMTSLEAINLVETSLANESEFLTRHHNHKPKASPKIAGLSINLDNCKYDIIRECAKDFGMKITTEVPSAGKNNMGSGNSSSWLLNWMDTGVSLERVLDLQPFQKINHFPGMTEICRKNSLARHARRVQRQWPKEFNFLPKSWELPHDLPDFEAHLRTRKISSRRKNASSSSSSYFIAKPDHGCQGKGIFLFKAGSVASTTALLEGADMIVQSYITNPYLIDGFKFDLRVYVLVTSIHPLRIFIYRDGLVRFATTPYSDPSSKNDQDMCMHLTNYAINKNSDGFNHDVGKDSGSKRTIQATFAKLKERDGVDVDAIWDKIEVAITKTILMAQPSLSRNMQGCFRSSSSHQSRYAEDAGSPCFEVLGFDIFLDAKLKAWVLEVNHSPSFTCDSPLDTEVKKALITDTFQLLNFNMVKFRKYLREQRKFSMRRLIGKPHNATKKTVTLGSSDIAAEINNKKNQEEAVNLNKIKDKGEKKIVKETANDSRPTSEASGGEDEPESECLLTEDEKQLLEKYFSVFNASCLENMKEREDKNLGNYKRIFPPENHADLAKYLKYMTIEPLRPVSETKDMSKISTSFNQQQTKLSSDGKLSTGVDSTKTRPMTTLVDHQSSFAKRPDIPHKLPKLFAPNAEIQRLKSKSLSEMVRIQMSVLRTMKEAKHVNPSVQPTPVAPSPSPTPLFTKQALPISIFPSPSISLSELQIVDIAKIMVERRKTRIFRPDVAFGRSPIHKSHLSSPSSMPDVNSSTLYGAILSHRPGPEGGKPTTLSLSVLLQNHHSTTRSSPDIILDCRFTANKAVDGPSDACLDE